MFTPQNNSQKNLSTDTEQFKSNRQQAQPQQPADLNKMNQNKEYPFKKKEEAQEKKLAGNKGAVEDILAGTDDDVPQNEPENEKNKVETQPSSLHLKEIPNVPSMRNKNVEEQKFQPPEKLTQKKVLPEQQLKPKSKLNIWTILIIVLVVAVLILAGVFAYQYFTVDESTTLENNNLDNNLQETEDLQQSNEDLMDFVNSLDETEQEEDLEDQEDLEVTMPNEDTDDDGLLDIEEAELGTNLNKSDSDDDGLPDFDEVMIYSTDPLNPDTDGDSYEDGDEVENGYDPLVPGSARL